MRANRKEIRQDENRSLEPSFSAHAAPRRRSAAFSVLALATALCGSLLPAQSATNPAPVFRNTNPSVAYVGSKTCVVPGCHEEIGRSYFMTPHGNSMAPANSPTELARAPQPVTVVNPRNGRTYEVYQEGGNLYQSACERNKKGRKSYVSTHKLDYVVGGDNTGYSYLFRIGGWIFQAPLSYYAPSKTWELSPGYAADDAGFDRVMTTGCLVCHNGQPVPQPRRDGQYLEPPFRFGELGISCESCHGPGALHNQEMATKKNSRLAPNEADTSIVNPAKLSLRVADDICRQCHQAGDAVVLNRGKEYMDFRPGTPLSETMNIVKRPLSAKEREEANRLETKPPVRGSLEQPLWWKNSTMELSKCYQASHGRVTCSTCHTIHHASSPEEVRAGYRAACLTCHTTASCTLKPEDSKRVAVGDYCIECHMEKRPIAGIAHSNDTKHRIVRYPGQPLPEIAFEQPKPDLPGLLWLNRPRPDAVFPADSQLDAYWTSARRDPDLWPYWSRKLGEMSKSHPDDPEVQRYLGVVAMGEKKDYAKAADAFSHALQAGLDDAITFLNLATAQEALGHNAEAASVLERGLAAYPYSNQMVAHLALRYAADGQIWRAEALIKRFRQLFPEDTVVRDAENQIEQRGNSGDAPGASRGAAVAPPR
jgi:hypothetical protein